MYRWAIPWWTATVASRRGRIKKITKKGKTLQPWVLMSLDFLKCFCLSLSLQKKKGKATQDIHYIVLCYPVLYISWNPRCRVQKKYSLRGKVNLQCSRSGKTIRWTGGEETRSKLFPPFFFPFFSIVWGAASKEALSSLECPRHHRREGSNDKWIQETPVCCSFIWGPCLPVM